MFNFNQVTRDMIINYGKIPEIINPKMLEFFLFLFNSRSDQICSTHKDVNENKDNYEPRKGSKFFMEFENLKYEHHTLFEINNNINEPRFNRLYFFKNFNGHTVLNWIDFFEKRIYFIDPKECSRNLVSNELSEFLNQTKIEIKELSNITDFNYDEFETLVYPFQYYQPDESDFQTELYLITIIYFLEARVPIWFTSKIVKEIMKVNFAYWLLSGTLQF